MCLKLTKAEMKACYKDIWELGLGLSKLEITLRGPHHLGKPGGS